MNWSFANIEDHCGIPFLSRIIPGEEDCVGEYNSLWLLRYVLVTQTTRLSLCAVLLGQLPSAHFLPDCKQYYDPQGERPDMQLTAGHPHSQTVSSDMLPLKH